MTISIDLGVVSDDRPDLRSRPPGPGPGRVVALAVCLLLAAGLLGASARSERQVLPEVRVPLGSGDAYSVDGGTLYLLGDGTITAHSVPGGERRWQSPLTTDHVFGVLAAGDVVLAYVSGEPGAQRFVALDAGTGALRWEGTGGPVFTGPESILLLTIGGYTDSDGPVFWERVRTGTGERMWRREFPSGTQLQVSDVEAEQFMATLPGGRVEIWETTVDRMVTSAEFPEDLQLTAQGNVAVGSVGDRLSGYSLPDLRLTWEREFATVTGWTYCDDSVFCLHTGDDRTIGLDPATGDVRWERPSQIGYLRLGPVLVADASSHPDGQGSLIVVDPGTGQTLRDFGRWQMIGYGRYGTAESVLVTQVNATATEMLVAELDVRALTLRVLGKIHEVGVDCASSGTVLLCRTQDNQVGMWELPISR
ncbi:outer membrane protein assembly factor BamB family protein [Catenuloplanes japonicus]|uniref:outer membrane protein assembly factor BamB family protein n=1 Tax=Catenuloplanes japonicus TaxID=33876 RepID=UPI000524E3CC|nr:PQQ-binding-like beta-propeller repeat protein [Catenuloplanes japonicus]